ncbi:DnaJ family domain-containing protein, partial [Ornithinicoccus halotolerans]|uniref:DnaJ family domain-containing protein n=1 Tax=Ornithinicoccus halotolerans TaxID=1748220 RepID=UPI001E54E36D
MTTAGQGSGETPGGARGEAPGEEQDTPTRRRMNLQHMQTYVEQTIQQAQRRGDFDDLPGKGRPLRGLDQPDDPDWWVKQLVEREKLDLSEALPPPVALRREKAGFPESLVELADEALVRERLRDFNARVLEERRRPWFGTSSPPIVGRVDVEEQVAAWRRLREQRARELRARQEEERARARSAEAPPAGA